MNLKILRFKVFQLLNFFPKGSDEIIDSNGERTLEALARFIDSNGQDAGKAPGEPAAAEPAEDVDEEGEEPGHEDL